MTDTKRRSKARANASLTDLTFENYKTLFQEETAATKYHSVLLIFPLRLFSLEKLESILSVSKSLITT